MMLVTYTVHGVLPDGQVAYQAATMRAADREHIGEHLELECRRVLEFVYPGVDNVEGYWGTPFEMPAPEDDNE